MNKDNLGLEANVEDPWLSSITPSNSSEDPWLSSISEEPVAEEEEDTLSDKKRMLVSSMLQEDEDTTTAYRTLESSLRGDREARMAAIQQEAIDEANTIAMDVVSSAFISEQVPQDQALAYMTDQINISEQKDASEKLLVDKMVTQGVMGETPEQEEARIARAADDVKEVIARRKLQQEVINRTLIDKEASVTSKVGDFLEYFIPLAENAKLAEVVTKLKSGETGITEAMLAMGESKIDFQNEFNKLSWQDQEGAFATIVAAVKSANGFSVLPNDIMEEDFVKTLTDPEHYGAGWQVADNIFTALDWLGMGGLFKSGRALAKTTGRALGSVVTGERLNELAVRAANARFMTTGEQPASVGRMADEANPDVAADLHVTAALDETGEASKVIYGGDEFTAHARELPQIDAETGLVTGTPTNLTSRVDMQAKADGRFDLSVAEELSALDFIKKKLSDTFGVVQHQELSSMPRRNEDGTFSVDSVYGRPDSPFRDPRYALEYVKIALKDFDISEANFQILRKDADGNYKPTTIEEVEALREARELVVKSKKKITDERLLKKNLIDDFQVRVKFDQVLNPRHVKYEETAVRKNFFDRVSALISGKRGSSSLTRYLVDPHSMFDFRITGGASQAFDKAAALEKELIDLSQPFIQGFKKLGNDRKEELVRVIKEANFHNKPFDTPTLRANGFSGEEIELLGSWKRAWDDIYILENRDLISTLRGQGFKILTTNDEKYFVRPQSQGAVQGKTALDPVTGEVVHLTKEVLDDLYKNGGRVGKTRDPFKMNAGDDLKIDLIIAHNSVGGAVMREFRNTDKALNYRQGYFSVRYQDPYFITMHRADLQSGGKAVKTAGDSQSAAAYVRQLNEGAPEGVTYQFRPARDLEPTDAAEAMLDLYEFSGRLNQSGRTTHRARGDRLGSTDEVLDEGIDIELGTVQEPIDSLLNSIRSISKRTSTRGFIERYKERFKSQYGHLIQDGMSFPNSAADLKVVGTASNKELADAKSHLEYIHSLEYSYANAIDDSYKSIMNVAAELVGGISPALEKGVRAVYDAVPAPTRSLRARSFETGIALNPFRQAVVQAHQSVMLLANFPKYTTAQLPRDLAAMMVMQKWRNEDLTKVKGNVLEELSSDLSEAMRLSGRSKEEIMDMSAAWKRSGMSAGVDKSTLLDDGFDSLISGSKAAKTWAALMKYPRKGFDVGEKFNLMTAWLAHYDKARGAVGKTLDQKQLDEVGARARNYTLNMNHAGEPPYNKNSFSVVFQYMQVPHKSFLQVFNRGLTRGERAKLAAVHAFVLPMPVSLGYSAINYMTEATGVELTEAQRYAIMNGLEGMFLNKAMELMTGEESSSDWSSLASFDPNAPYELVKALMTTDIIEIVAATPAGSLFVGHNPRIANMARELGRFILPPEGEDRDLGVLLKTFADYSSGVANFSKSFKALQVRKFYNSMGGVSDDDVSTGEAIAKAFGFRSFEEAMNYEVKRDLYLQSDDARKDIKEQVRLQSQALARRGITQDEREYLVRMTSVFNNLDYFASNKHRELYWSEIEKQARKNDNGLLSQLLTSVGYEDPMKLHNMATAAGFGEEFKEVVDHIKNIKDESGDW